MQAQYGAWIYNMKKSDLKVNRLPDAPGVYFFKDSRGSILYVGKATSLRDRVRSYFGDDLIDTRGPLLVDMVTKAKRIEFKETDSVLEALILEAHEIKTHQPKYNTKDKDDKSFNYVVITKEDFPRIFTMRGRELVDSNSKHKAVYGPFPQGGSLNEALKIIRKIFPFRDKKAGTKGNDTFYRQIGLSPDISSVDAKKEYAKTIRNIKLFFDAKKVTLLKKLEKEMMTYATKKEFEKASIIKKQIFALQHIQDVALIKSQDTHSHILKNVRMFRIEAYDVAHMSGGSMVGVMAVIESGEPSKKEYRKFTIKGFSSSNDTGALKEILDRRFGHPEWSAPNLIVVDGGKAQKNAAERVLKDLDLPIPVVAVVKNERHQPKDILGNKKNITHHEVDILKANAEAHRFSISFHRNVRRKKLLGK